jgi:hypothetical protein
MVLVGLIVLLTAVHTFVVGPRQLRMLQEMRADTPEAMSLRRASMILSSLNLLASIAIVFAGALLANHEYSFQPV